MINIVLYFSVQAHPHVWDLFMLLIFLKYHLCCEPPFDLFCCIYASLLSSPKSLCLSPRFCDSLRWYIYPGPSITSFCPMSPHQTGLPWPSSPKRNSCLLFLLYPSIMTYFILLNIIHMLMISYCTLIVLVSVSTVYRESIGGWIRFSPKVPMSWSSEPHIWLNQAVKV